jgi:heme A synthase
MRRLRIAIENLSVSSDNYARQMRRWTIVVVFLTLVQAIAAAAVIIAAFPIIIAAFLVIKAWFHLLITIWFD